MIYLVSLRRIRIIFLIIILVFSFQVEWAFGQDTNKDAIEYLDVKLDQDQEGLYLSKAIKLEMKAGHLVSFSIQMESNVNYFYKEPKSEKWSAVKATHKSIESELELVWSDLTFPKSSEIIIRATKFAPIHVMTQSVAAVTYKSNNVESRYCRCNPIHFKTRDLWCPDGTCPKDPTPVKNKANFFIVHHTAGGFDASDYDQVVRSYYRFHVDTRGWDDIGYNFLIAPNGDIYEGRGRNLLGAHFCGKNTGTEGIGLIGDYTNRQITDQTQNALEDLLSYHLCLDGLKALDTSYHTSGDQNLGHISGHRDGCATECPGNTFYPLLDEIRSSVSNRILDSCILDSLFLNLNENTGVGELIWNDPYDDEHGFYIKVADENGAWCILDTLTEDISKFDFVFPSDRGTVSVQAFFNDQNGPESNLVSWNITNITDPVFLELSKDKKIEVWNSNGQKVFKGTAEKFDFFTVQRGLYFIHDGEKTKKILRN